MKASEVLILLVGLAAVLYISEACNESVCASLVTKCQLIRSCECDMSDKKNCSCCMNCQLCLAQLYSECCSCVGMCPKPDPEDSILKSSTIEDLPDPIPELFNVLTEEEEDYYQRWSTYRYPVYYDTLYSKHVNQATGKNSGERGLSQTHVDSAGLYNCTVAFMSECMKWRECRQSCKSMGSTKYRWFHEGCCQCVGDRCMDYGLNEPMCLKCKSAEEEAEIEELLEDSNVDDLSKTIDTEKTDVIKDATDTKSTEG